MTAKFLEVVVKQGDNAGRYSLGPPSEIVVVILCQQERVPLTLNCLVQLPFMSVASFLIKILIGLSCEVW